MDLSIFDERYRNEETRLTAYDPKIMLKIILFAYSRGITSSRRIAQACEENVIFMSLSCDTQPHFTTIADFVSTMGKEISQLFRIKRIKGTVVFIKNPVLAVMKKLK